MKRPTKLKMLLTVLLFTVVTTSTIAQSKTNTNLRYSEMVGENPNAEADIMIVSDYLKSVIAGDINKAKTLLSSDYKGYGPALNDISNYEQTFSEWEEMYKLQNNRKVDFVTQTFLVKSGDLQGNWVSVWGDYSFTMNGVNLKIPFQYTARVANGKIEIDQIYYDRLYIIKTLGYNVTPPENMK